MGKMVHVRIGGREYDIPDIWIAGMCQNNGLTYLQAVEFWHYQAELERLEDEAE